MPSLLTRGQKRLLSLLLALGLYILANSAYLVVSQPHEEVLPVFYQVMLLSHLAVGGLLLVLATIFIFWHLKRVKRLWHRSAAASGGGLTLAVYLLFASGIFILSEANSLQHRWIFWSHRILAVLAPAAYVTHRLVSHFRPAPRALLRAGLVFAGLFVLMVGVHHSTVPTDPWGGKTYAVAGDRLIPFEPDNYPDPSSPFWPSRTTTDSGYYLEERIITRNERGDFERIRADVERFGFAVTTALGAETCTRCHAEIVSQWKRSAHRFASFNNPLYRAAVERFREEKGKKASQWCAGCHDPAIMLAGNMEKEIDPLTPESQAGLTCLACHAIESIHGIEGNGGYHIGDERPSPYLFDSDSSGLGRATADLLIKSKPAVHKRQLLKPFFRTSEYCAVCHKVSLDVPVNGYRYIRGQDEYDASINSGVAHGSAGTFYLPDQPKNCQDCHMPRVEARLPDVSAKGGTVRSHLFVAANDALPHLRGDHEMREQIHASLRDRKLRIDVFALQRRRDGARVLALDRANPALVAGEEIVFEVVVRNVGVGHTFPGGTNDSNQAWVEFTITDEQGNTLGRRGWVDEERYVDRKAHFYKVIFVDEQGQARMKRDPHNFRALAFARVIGPGLADLSRYRFTIPEAMAGKKLTIRARLMWRKFNREYMKFVFGEAGMKVPDLPHLKGQAIPDLPVTAIAENEVTLDVAREWRAPAPVDDGELWQRFNDHGIANLRTGAFDVAERSFAEVVRLRPDLPDGYRNQARRWIRGATPKRAVPLLEKINEIAPTDPQRAWFWGRYLERIEEFEEAEKQYLRTTQVFPSDRNAWRALGRMRFKLHRYEEALDAYLEVLRIDNEDVESHRQRAHIYRLLGKPKEAAEAQKAHDKYRMDDLKEQWTKKFLLEHPEINDSAQPRHIYALD